MTLRHFLGRKMLFHDALLPLLRTVGPSGCDAALRGLGRIVSAWPSKASDQARAIESARRALDADWDVAATRRALAANVVRSSARDYPLDIRSTADVLARFDVHGGDRLESALALGRGAIVLGCHLGAYLPGLHWLYRREVPVRLLVQRPGHVSRYVRDHFDRDDGPHPQSGFFLRRRMPAGEGAQTLIRARAALRDGLAVYVCGDVPWPSCHARPGTFLGHSRPFQSAWADLSAITGAPVVPLFCLHKPGGRYDLSFDPSYHPDPKTAVPRYLERLESLVADHPSEAVAYLTWPCYSEDLVTTPERPITARPEVVS